MLSNLKRAKDLSSATLTKTSRWLESFVSATRLQEQSEGTFAGSTSVQLLHWLGADGAHDEYMMNTEKRTAQPKWADDAHFPGFHIFVKPSVRILKKSNLMRETVRAQNRIWFVSDTCACFVLCADNHRLYAFIYSSLNVFVYEQLLSTRESPRFVSLLQPLILPTLMSIFPSALWRTKWKALKVHNQ